MSCSRGPTSSRLHLPKTPETIGWIDAESIAKMKDGARIVNCARGELVDLDALQQGLESGKLGGAALDVFPEEPPTQHPLFERDDVVVTPHLGASTAEAQDRAGMVTAEQVTAALTDGVVTYAVNIGAVRPEHMEALAPFVPLSEKLGKLAQGLAEGPVDRVTGRAPGPPRRARLAPARDRRALGILSGHTEEQVNLVNSASLAEERGIDLVEITRPVAEDFTDSSPCASRRVGKRSRSPAPASVRATSPTWSRPLGRGLLPAVGRAPRGLPLRRPAGDDRPRGHDLRRAGRQHRLGRRRRRVRRPVRGHGPHHRRAGEPGDDRGDPASSTASQSAAPSTSRRGSGSGVRAVVQTKNGGPRCCEVQERPTLRSGRARSAIAVKAAGINFADTMARVGLYPDAPKPPCVMGYEVAGDVERWRGGDGLKAGDRVPAGTRFGGQAELAVVPAENVRRCRSTSTTSRAPRSR